MRKTFLLLALCVLILGSVAQRAAAEPVFPGAQGFGVQTPAGRGGRIIRVTSLKGEGPGSLREALQTKGPRIVVFEVGGVIDLEKKKLSISQPFLTLAGQTAPAPGITLIRGSLYVSTHDVLIQHIRVRPGDAGAPKRSGWSPEVSTVGGNAWNIVIDHCSMTWAVDENLSVSGPRHEGRKGTSHDVTLSYCIIAEGLNNSSHEKGPHSKGTLIHDWCSNVAVIGNLYAHNRDRNPLFKGGCTGVVVNNLIYNPGVASIQARFVESEYKGAPDRPEASRISVAGNVMRYGPDTKKGLQLVSGAGNGEVYLKDNAASDRQGGKVALVSPNYRVLSARPVWPEGLKAMPSSEVAEAVLKHAGARPAERDAIDRRIVETVRQRAGRVIDSQEEVGGYPKDGPTARKLEIPTRGIEAWLARMAAAVE